jgi:hypothetical protein
MTESTLTERLYWLSFRRENNLPAYDPAQLTPDVLALRDKLVAVFRASGVPFTGCLVAAHHAHNRLIEDGYWTHD